VAHLERLPDDGNRYEILHGELLVTLLPSNGHQGVAMRLARRVSNWCHDHTGWATRAPGGVYISETTWLEPDVAVYPAPEYDDLPWQQMPPPVLVVEVLSRATRKRDRHRKRPAYLSHGVGEVWLIDKRSRFVERWTVASELKDYYTVAIDQRGYDLSDHPAGVEQYDMSLLVGDGGSVIKSLGREKAIVMGQDWGGAVAWSVAMYQPQVVEKLIILNLPHLRGLRRELAANPLLAKNSQYARNFQQDGAAKTLTAEGLASWIGRSVPSRRRAE